MHRLFATLVVAVALLVAPTAAHADGPYISAAHPAAYGSSEIDVWGSGFTPATSDHRPWVWLYVSSDKYGEIGGTDASGGMTYTVDASHVTSCDVTVQAEDVHTGLYSNIVHLPCDTASSGSVGGSSGSGGSTPCSCTRKPNYE